MNDLLIFSSVILDDNTPHKGVNFSFNSLYSMYVSSLRILLRVEDEERNAGPSCKCAGQGFKKNTCSTLLASFLFVPNADHQAGLLRGSHFWLPRKFSQSHRVSLRSENSFSSRRSNQKHKGGQVYDHCISHLFNSKYKADQPAQRSNQTRKINPVLALIFSASAKKVPKVKQEADASNWDPFHLNLVAKLLVE